MKLTKLALATALFCATSGAQAITGYSHVWTYNHASTGAAGQTSEIAAFDASTQTLWVAGVAGIDVLNANTGALVQHIDTTAYGSVNSVAIKDGIAAIAIEDSVRTNAGTIRLFDTNSMNLTSGINTITVGSLPDMVTFSPDGSKLLVANEATPTTYGSTDPVGSVSIIDMNTRTVTATAGFAGVATSGSNIRTNTGMDFEPEYITISADGTQAFVSLQEANAMAVLDLNTNSFTNVIGLGVKNFSAPGNEIDPKDNDGVINLRSAAVSGLYQPDAMAAYDVSGNTFIVMANEGDTREDDADKSRASASGIAGVPADLGRLNISTTDSSAGNLVTFGGRSFSIRDENGNIVFDSGNELEAEAIARGIYADSRSDDKGVEPEGVALMEIYGRTFAFIGLERTTTGATAIYDITDPNNASFIDFIMHPGDIAPEGLLAFSMNGGYYLGVANEVSGTTSLYQLQAVPVPAALPLLLSGMVGLFGFGRKKK